MDGHQLTIGGVPERVNLDDLAGTWVDDPEFDRAIEEQHRIDPELRK